MCQPDKHVCNGAGFQPKRCEECLGRGYLSTLPWSSDIGRAKSIAFGCGCKYRQPKCEMGGGCDQFATVSIFMPWLPQKFKFSCYAHYENHYNALRKFMPGLEPHPDNQDPEWRGSIKQVVKHTHWAEQFEKRKTEPAPDVFSDFEHVPRWVRRYNPQQLAQWKHMREMLRNEGHTR
jgi:hypothetical protein